MKCWMMTKYEILYGKPISHFPNEENNVREKLRLVTIEIGKIYDMKKPYTYENSCEMHELEQAKAWCRKILEDIEDD